MKQPSWVACGVVLGFTLQLSTNVVAAPRVWTSANGKFTIKAELIDYSDEDVRLKKEDGSTVTVAKEHLRETDWEFALNSPLSIYRLDGVLQVRNPRAKLNWKVFLQDEVEGVQILVLQSGHDAQEGFVQITVQPLSDESVAANPLQQFQISTLFLTTTIQGFAEGGIIPVDMAPPNIPESDMSSPVVFAVSMLRAEDGVKLEFRHRTVFGNRNAYHVMVFAPNKREADKLIEVCNTVTELEETLDEREED